MYLSLRTKAVLSVSSWSTALSVPCHLLTVPAPLLMTGSPAWNDGSFSFLSRARLLQNGLWEREHLLLSSCLRHRRTWSLFEKSPLGNWTSSGHPGFDLLRGASGFHGRRLASRYHQYRHKPPYHERLRKKNPLARNPEVLLVVPDVYEVFFLFLYWAAQPSVK